MMRRRSLMGGGAKGYIEFANEKIGAYFAEKYGDGIGITYDQAAAITEFDSKLQLKTIVGSGSYTFEELNYFTGLVSLPVSFFTANSSSSYDCHISQLSLPNLTTIGRSCFMYSTILEINCPKLATIGSYAIRFSKTKRIILGDAYTTIAENWPISDNDDLEYLYFSNLQSVNAYAITRCNNTNLKVYIATPSGPPTISVYYPKGCFGANTAAKLYVPSNLISAYTDAGAPWTTDFASINAI